MEFSQLDKTLPTTKKDAPGKLKLVLISLSAFLALLSIILLLLLLNSKTVYQGVRIQGTDVGGYTRGELSAFLEEHYTNIFENVDLTLASPQFERKVTVSELGIGINIGAMVERAYSLGRTGNIIDRLSKIAKLYTKHESVALILEYETQSFSDFLDRVCQEVYREIIPSNIVIQEDSVTLCTGISGQEANKELLKKDILNKVQQLKSARIIIPVIEKQTPPIDVETTLKTLNREPVNAEFVKTSRTTYEIKPHQMGLKLDRAKLMEVVNYVENRENQEYEEIPLPVEFITPALTEDVLKAQIFRDTLSSYTTRFNTDSENNKNRAVNIGLAAESIDGTLLMPGEEFSFNKTVGPRTPEKGYKTAHIFIDGQIQDGTGGGICQVSTTLYNAVLNANLEVKERHNHMFTVGYVPLGQDAAVSYGYADLVFKNTTAYPMRIIASVSDDNSINFKILSTNDYPGLKVKLASRIISTTPFTVQYLDDSTLPLGAAVVSENGMNGYVVDTYMSVFNGDVLIREEKLHRSIYQMLPRKILKGTGPVSEMIQ